jgi:transposase-like protein
MTFQRKYDDAFKQKAVATDLQKGKKTEIAQSLG